MSTWMTVSLELDKVHSCSTSTNTKQARKAYEAAANTKIGYTVFRFTFLATMTNATLWGPI